MITALFPGAAPVVLGHATTVTYSTYRELSDVRSLGRIGVKSFARGGRTVAGTMIFTVINRHWLNEVRRQIGYLNLIPVMRPDELPHFDLIITGANEYGQEAVMVLYGVAFVDDGSAISVENLFSENQLTYKAHDIRLFDNVNVALSSSVSFADPSNMPVYSLPPVANQYASPGAQVDGPKKTGGDPPVTPVTPPLRWLTPTEH